MKKILLSLLALILMLVSTSAAFAFEKVNDKSVKITKVYRVTESGLKEVSLEEYLKAKADSKPVKKESSAIIDSKTTPQDIYSYYRYDESGSSLVRRTDLRTRVSRYVENRTSSSVSYTVSYSKTQGYELSTSLNSEEFSALKSGVSFTWYDSASVSDSATLTISPQHVGWWEFDPLMNKSWGYIKKVSTLGDILSSKYCTSYSPKKVNGMLDGYLIACEAPL